MFSESYREERGFFTFILINLHPLLKKSEISMTLFCTVCKSEYSICLRKDKKINKRHGRIIKMMAKYILNEIHTYFLFPPKHKIFKIIIQMFMHFLFKR